MSARRTTVSAIFALLNESQIKYERESPCHHRPRRANRKSPKHLLLRQIREPARALLLDDRRSTMTQTPAALGTWTASRRMYLVYIDSIIIHDVLVLYFSRFNNQSYENLDFSLSIDAIMMKMAPLPFLAHRCFLSSLFWHEWLYLTIWCWL